MSSAPLYDLGVVVVIRALENLLSYTKSAEKWADEKDVSKDSLVNGKLIDDMKPLSFQVQSACNSAKFIYVRIAGVENPVQEDNETTLPQLYERIENTIAFLKKAKPEEFQGKEDSDVVFKAGPAEMKFKAVEYLQVFAIPNFFFHQVTAFAILRKMGASIGKYDYLDGDGSVRARVGKK